MANSTERDLMSIGTHCSNPFCRRLDFLPFKCEICNNKFCLKHFQPMHHDCKEPQIKDSQLPQCPLCFQYVLKGTQKNDDNVQIENHISSGCTTLLYEKRKKNKCNQSGCKSSSLIPFHCDKCYRSYCVRHRHSADHRCIRPERSILIAAR